MPVSEEIQKPDLFATEDDSLEDDLDDEEDEFEDDLDDIDLPDEYGDGIQSNDFDDMGGDF